MKHKEFINQVLYIVEHGKLVYKESTNMSLLAFVTNWDYKGMHKIIKNGGNRVKVRKIADHFTTLDDYGKQEWFITLREDEQKCCMTYLSLDGTTRYNGQVVFELAPYAKRPSTD